MLTADRQRSDHPRKEHASKTLRDVRGAWVKDMKVVCEDAEVVPYRINLKLTFVLDDGDASDGSDKDEDK
jgi:hypothetical protein